MYTNQNQQTCILFVHKVNTNLQVGNPLIQLSSPTPNLEISSTNPEHTSTNPENQTQLPAHLKFEQNTHKTINLAHLKLFLLENPLD